MLNYTLVVYPDCRNVERCTTNVENSNGSQLLTPKNRRHIVPQHLFCRQRPSISLLSY